MNTGSESPSLGPTRIIHSGVWRGWACSPFRRLRLLRLWLRECDRECDRERDWLLLNELSRSLLRLVRREETERPEEAERDSLRLLLLSLLSPRPFFRSAFFSSLRCRASASSFLSTCLLSGAFSVVFPTSSAFSPLTFFSSAAFSPLAFFSSAAFSQDVSLLAHSPPNRVAGVENGAIIAATHESTNDACAGCMLG